MRSECLQEIGRADELGSGVRNIFNFCKAYTGADPELMEEGIFRIIIPFASATTEQATEQAKREEKILKFCLEKRSMKEIMEFLHMKHREHFRSEILNPMIEKGLLLLSIPEKPNSPKQKYYSSKKADK